jgi:hypothetical protein
MKRAPTTYGDPEKTPFIRFESGTPVYPPNTIYECARELLREPEEANLTEMCVKLTERGQVGGQHTVMPAATWFALFENFFRYENDTPGPASKWQDYCRQGLQLMLERPHQAAWKNLKTFLKSDVDNLSGWNKSWQKSTAERYHVFRGENGNYYYHDQDRDGILIHVIGQKTIEETRLDFITDQLLRSYGFLHQFIALFSLFAIADDYSRIPERYPKVMKAVLSVERFGRSTHYWHFLFNDRTRSIAWRPESNMCDPQWLVADLMGEITDTLNIDHWQQRVDTRRADSSWIESDCQYQADYIIESGLRLGSDEEVLIEFEGKKFRWFNGTVERDAIVSMGVKDLTNHQIENEKLNRLLTSLVWQHKVHVRKLWGVGGPKRPYPMAYGPRQAGGTQVDPQYVLGAIQRSYTPAQWFALALYREAVNSGSDFYSFLCYWKVIELAYSDHKARKEWINTVASRATREKERLAKVLAQTTDLENYLRNERRHAVAHVFQDNRNGSKTQNRPVNPDDPGHEATISQDIHLVEDFATLAIEEMLKK